MLVIESKNDFDYGRKVGADFGPFYRRLISRTRPLSPQGLRCRRAVLEERYPQALERMEGLARTAGLERERVLAAGPGNPWRMSGCTNFAAVPPATLDGQSYVSWNLDLPGFFRQVIGRFPLYVRRIGGCKPYLCMGSPLLFGIGVINTDGLCAAINAVGMTDGGEGLTAFELNNLYMETCSTVEEALAAAEANPRQTIPGIMSSMLLNANTLLADAGGEAALLEYGHSHLLATRAADHGGVLASANHHQFLDRGLTGSPDPVIEPAITGSYARLARMWELLGIYQGTIDPAVAAAITSDHGANYDTLKEFGMERPWYRERVDDSTICAHPWNFWRHLRRGEVEEAITERLISMTLYRFLMQPRRCTVWFGRGYPCRGQYQPLWLGDLLEMAGADKARGELDYEPTAASFREGDDQGLIFSRPVRDTRLNRSCRGALIGMVLGLDRLFQRLNG
jgi:hypothetical protein